MLSDIPETEEELEEASEAPAHAVAPICGHEEAPAAAHGSAQDAAASGDVDIDCNVGSDGLASPGAAAEPGTAAQGAIEHDSCIQVRLLCSC